MTTSRFRTRHGSPGTFWLNCSEPQLERLAASARETLASLRLMLTNTGRLSPSIPSGFSMRAVFLGIRETIFESDHFADTQLIVTCHSNEFIKDIQQHLPAQRRQDCQVYLFRHHTGNYQPRVTGNIPNRNYIAKARASKDSLDNREALASCRQGLEMLSEKVWRWLASHDLGVLNLQLAGVGAEPSLRNLSEALYKRLNDAATFNHVNKPVLMAALGRLLGIPAANLVWTYLNKGTHEEADRDDFDADVVESVVQTLEALDGLELRVGR